MQMSLWQELRCFRKPASQLITYEHIYPIIGFRILVIIEAILQATAVKFVSDWALNSYSNKF